MWVMRSGDELSLWKRPRWRKGIVSSSYFEIRASDISYTSRTRCTPLFVFPRSWTEHARPPLEQPLSQWWFNRDITERKSEQKSETLSDPRQTSSTLFVFSESEFESEQYADSISRRSRKSSRGFAVRGAHAVRSLDRVLPLLRCTTYRTIGRLDRRQSVSCRVGQRHMVQQFAASSRHEAFGRGTNRLAHPTHGTFSQTHSISSRLFFFYRGN